jgi:hypothetical protein
VSTFGPVEAAVRKDLRRLPAGSRGGALAASALALARLLDEVEPGVTADKRMAAAAQAARELRSTMGDLLKDAPTARSGIDDLRARRQARKAASGSG